MLHAQKRDFVPYKWNVHKVKLTYFQQSLGLDIKLKHKEHNAVLGFLGSKVEKCVRKWATGVKKFNVTLTVFKQITFQVRGHVRAEFSKVGFILVKQRTVQNQY